MGNKATCSNCGKPIWRNSPGGDWLHRTTASSACYPGRGARRYASPVEVETH